LGDGRGISVPMREIGGVACFSGARGRSYRKRKGMGEIEDLGRKE